MLDFTVKCGSVPRPRRRGLFGVRARARPVPVVPLAAAAFLVEIQTQLLELEIVLDQLLLLVVQLAQFILIRRDLLAHYAHRVPAEPLPLSRQLATLLPVVVQEAAEIAQFLVIVVQSLVGLLQRSQLIQLESR